MSDVCIRMELNKERGKAVGMHVYLTSGGPKYFKSTEQSSCMSNFRQKHGESS